MMLITFIVLIIVLIMLEGPLSPPPSNPSSLCKLHPLAQNSLSFYSQAPGVWVVGATLDSPSPVHPAPREERWLGLRNIGSPTHVPLHQSWRRSSMSRSLGTFKKTYFCFKSGRERRTACLFAICWAPAQSGCWLFRGPWSPPGILFPEIQKEEPCGLESEWQWHCGSSKLHIFVIL